MLSKFSFVQVILKLQKEILKNSLNIIVKLKKNVDVMQELYLTQTESVFW